VAPVEPASGGPLAFVGTLLVSWALSAYAAQVAASFFLGDPPWKRAAVVGLVPAVVTVALVRYSVAVILAVALAADLAAVRAVYRVHYRTVALIAVLHVSVTIALSVTITYLLRLFATAPG
jgi:hypothetical protein